MVKGPVNPHTGYGNDILGMVTTLAQLGCDVYLDPSHVSTPLPPHIADLFTKRLKPPFDLLLHHTDPGQLGISKGAAAASDLAVAWTMWEFATLDNCRGRSTLRRRLKDYDLVVGYDQVSTDALRPYVSTKQATVQGGYWPELWKPMQRDWFGDRFSFAMVGALHDRKNPFVAIEAFKELKDEEPDFAPAELHLKTVEPGLHRKMEDWAPGLHIHYEVWPHEQLREFYGSQHVLLAPSRGEGKNMPALEFLSTGGTTIATNWGGHRQWLSNQYAYPLDYELRPLTGGQPKCLCASASKAHLKALMLHTFRNRAEVRRRGEAAAAIIPQMCGWQPVVERLFSRIAEAYPSTGQPMLQFIRRSIEARNADR